MNHSQMGGVLLCFTHNETSTNLGRGHSHSSPVPGISKMFWQLSIGAFLCPVAHMSILRSFASNPHVQLGPMGYGSTHDLHWFLIVFPIQMASSEYTFTHIRIWLALFGTKVY
jgi:hypothetical protein